MLPRAGRPRAPGQAAEFAPPFLASRSSTLCCISGPNINLTNETSIPLKVLITLDLELYRSAIVGQPIGSHQNWTDLEAGCSEDFPRPDPNRESYILILSPNNAPLVLATFAMGAYLKGSKTKAMSLSLDLDDNHASGSFTLGPPGSVASVAPGSAPVLPGEAPGASTTPADQRRAKGFKVTMALKLRGNDLPVKDHGLMGGKSDPFWELRPAFGSPGGMPYVSPNKDSRGNDLPKRNYEGKHQTQPFVKSEVVTNELNPSWQTMLIELNELMEGTVVDLNKSVLIDVWDWDRGGDSDFMCYREVKLQELMDAAKSKAPLPLMPPPEGHQQNVGRLYVDRAIIGYPEVLIRASTSKEEKKTSEGLVIRNCCPVPLKVLVEDDAAAFAGMRVGQSLSQLQHHKCIVISAPSTKSGGVIDYRSGCLTTSMLAGSTSAMLLILNESDLIVGKKSLPCNGTRDLYMDLENGAFALAASTVKDELLSNYTEAKERVGDVSSSEVTLTEDDMQFFLDKWHQSADMALLLPAFGQELEGECMDLESYQALIDAQLKLIKQSINECDFVTGEGDQVARLCDMFKKLHIIDFKCGQPRGEVYQEMVEVLRSMFESLMEECSRHLERARFEDLVNGLSSLKAASTTRLVQHVRDEEFISAKYTALLDSINAHMKQACASVQDLVTQRSATKAAGFSEEEAKMLQESWQALSQAVAVNWGEHVNADEFVSLKGTACKALGNYFKALEDSAEAQLSSSQVEGKLAQCNKAMQEAVLIANLDDEDDLEIDNLLNKMLKLLDSTQQEIETRLRAVAIFCGSGWSGTAQSEDAPSLDGLNDLVQDLFMAEWAKEQGGAARFESLLQGISSCFTEAAEALLGHAKTSMAGGTDGGLLKVVYIAQQMQVIKGVVDSHTDELAPFKGMAEMESVVKASAESLTQRVNWLLPWHANPESLELTAAGNMNAWDAEVLMLSIEALVKYDGSFEGLRAMFQGGVRAVMQCLSQEVNTSFPTLNHDGSAQIDGLDRLGLAMRAGARIKKEHARLYSLGLCGDFMSGAVQKLAAIRDKLKSALQLSSADAGKTEELLQTVRALSTLDDAFEDPDHTFDALYRQYEAQLRERLDGHVNDVLELITTGKYSDAEMMMEQHGMQTTVPWQIKAEISNKIEKDLEDLMRKVLPTAQRAQYPSCLIPLGSFRHWRRTANPGQCHRMPK